MNKILLEVKSSEELKALISKAVESALTKSSLKKKELNDDLLTTDELGAFLKLSRVSIWALTKNGIIPFLRVGNQKRYQKSKVLEKLTEINHPKSLDYGKD